MSKLEIEKRYLCRANELIKFLEKNLINYTITNLEQFYLIANVGETLRYRKEDDIYIKNQKFGSGLIREEKESRVSKKEYKTAKKHNRAGVIKKLRYRFKIDNDIYELDVFKGKLKGLSILEIEFSDIYKAKEFKIPNFLDKFIIKEITNESIYSNAALSRSMKIPLRDDSKLSLNSINNQDILKPKFDLYISEYENSKYAILNSIKRVFISFEKNFSLFFKIDEYKYLKKAYIALLKIRAILKRFKKYIYIDSYNRLLLNIDIMITSLEKIIELNMIFRKILKSLSSLPIKEKIKRRELLLKIAKDEKRYRDKLKLKDFIKTIDNLKKDLNISIFKSNIEKPLFFIKDKILKKIDKKFSSNIGFYKLFELKSIYEFFNTKFPYKNLYKKAKQNYLASIENRYLE